jgi:integrase
MYHLIRPSGNKRQWDFRAKMPNGLMKRFPGDRNRQVAEDRARKTEQLINAVIMGVPPSAGLNSWIEGLPDKFAMKLIREQLLDRRRIEQKQPIDAHCTQFTNDLFSRGVGLRYAIGSGNRVRRLFQAMKIATFAELTSQRILDALKDFNALTGCRKKDHVSKKTQREYIMTIKSFCAWMVESSRAMSNPVMKLKAPGAYVDPTRTRCPLSVPQFEKLFAHTYSVKRYPNQQARWSGRDRAILYWVAVKTGLRMSELRSLTCSSLDLNAVPPTITVEARNAKNNTRGIIPIPQKLADVLKEYIAGSHPASSVFPMPRESWSVLLTFYRDLEGAGIPKKLPSGDVIDFHTLRSTAITWWLTEDRLSLKQAQSMARLKTLDLVQKYTRGYQMTDCGFLDRGPTFKLPDPPDQGSDDQQGGAVAVPRVGPRGGGVGPGAAHQPPVEAFSQPGCF